MVKAPITCKICESTEPFDIGWELFDFLDRDQKTVIPHNICFTCCAVIREKIYHEE